MPNLEVEPMVPYHGLNDPTPPEPRRVQVDVSPYTDWDGGDAMLGAAGAELVAVPPAVRSHVTRMRKLGAAAGEAGLDLREYLPKLREATKESRAALARLESQRAEAVGLGTLNEHQLIGMDAVQAAPKAKAQNAIQTAAQVVAREVITQLAKEETAALAALQDSPGVRPTAADYTEANELVATLNLLPVSLAVPLLVGRLVEQPAKAGGKGLGLTVAALPLLRGKFETDPAWNASGEATDLLRLCEVVTRDSTWYAAHKRLARIGQLQSKISMLTQDYLDAFGDEKALGAISTRSAFFADLGVGA